MTTEPLYRGQTAAHNVFDNRLFFPRFSNDYIKSQEGLKGHLTWCYNLGYDGLSLLDDTVQKALSLFSSVVSETPSWASHPFTSVYDTVFPVNPINGKPHFIVIPRAVEKFLGDYFFYPFNTFGMSTTSELMPGTQETMARHVNTVVERLKINNQNLLNPPSETPFDYRAKTIISSDINAFAVPAGGMVVFSQIVKELQGAIVSHEIEETTVEFADGSTVTVNLRGVTMDDALAALIGHEMTHVASRHSIVAIAVSIVRSLILSVGRIFLVGYLKSLDPEYRQLTRIPQGSLFPADHAALEDKEQLYTMLNQVLYWIQERLEILDNLFRSRQNEYEADVTGAYFASQANFNPLGALYLQEFLKQKGSCDSLHKHLEFLFSHPYAEKRKRAIFASLASFTPQSLRGRLSHWQHADNSAYDAQALSGAMIYSHAAHRSLGG